MPVCQKIIMKMMIRYIFCGVILMICSALNVVAQVQVVQEINPIAIYIGQQAKMSVTVTAPEGSKIEFPHFERSQYLVPGVEVLSAVGDTSSIDGKLRITRVFTLTSFDEHLYALPPLPVKVGGKEFTHRFHRQPTSTSIIVKLVSTPISSSRRRMCRTIPSNGATGVRLSG